MSLINDALKRARQLHKKATPPPGSEIPLQPVENNPKRSASWLGLLGAVILVGLAAWMFMNWWNARTPPPKAAAGPPAVTNRSIAKRMVGALSAASNVVHAVTNLRAEAESVLASNKIAGATSVHTGPTPTVAESNRVASPATTQVEVAVATGAPASPQPSAKSETTNAPVSRATAEAASSSMSPLPSARSAALSNLKLQGIYYRISKPSVLINNRTLFVGDEIEGARVVAIERYSVKLDLGGKTNLLTLK